MIVLYEIMKMACECASSCVCMRVRACVCGDWDRGREGEENTHCCASGEFGFVCKLFKILLKQTSLVEREVIPYQI